MYNLNQNQNFLSVTTTEIKSKSINSPHFLKTDQIDISWKQNLKLEKKPSC